jgi:hypothetical protein
MNTAMQTDFDNLLTRETPGRSSTIVPHMVAKMAREEMAA